ncbi:hypothetical protein FCS83_06705 [Oenococcus sp. UCMA 17063]|nr:hypothetical protein [Oenococcus sp. UCMA 17063]
MSIVGKIAPFALGLGLIAGASMYSANAVTINLNDKVPSAGGVTLDDSDKAVSASSPVIYDLAKKAEKNSTSLLYSQSKAAINYANSRWVYYSDNHNYFTGYKRGHSNYFHRTERHGSYAAVGNKNTGIWKYVDAGKWSYSSDSGIGTFVAKYDAPYN